MVLILLTGNLSASRFVGYSSNEAELPTPVDSPAWNCDLSILSGKMDLKLFQTASYCFKAVRDSVWLNKALDRFDELVFSLIDLRSPKDPT
ncbi:MAG: hypothetical protein NTY15_11720, partial [Planctomycetota bacterium]|nr:hypothetical protein [Planctomycetota bacterium]